MLIDQFIQNYPEPVAVLLHEVRADLLRRYPALKEELDSPSKIISYSIAPGMKGVVFTLIPSQKGVKLGIYRGRDLPDPSGLMEGSGRVHAYVKMSHEILPSPHLQQLMEAAVGAAIQRNSSRN